MDLIGAHSIKCFFGLVAICESPSVFYHVAFWQQRANLPPPQVSVKDLEGWVWTL